MKIALKMGVTCDLKIVMLGSAYVGKTSLVKRLAENTFIVSNKYSNTIGAAFVVKKVTLPTGRTVSLGIWDTAGEERFESISRTFYRGSDAAIVCYDVTYARSWERAKRWINELKHNEEDCKIYMCATKVDLLKNAVFTRVIPMEQVNLYVTTMNVKYFETSSKTGENIDLLFKIIAQDYTKEYSPLTTSVINLSGTKSKWACC